MMIVKLLGIVDLLAAIMMITARFDILLPVAVVLAICLIIKGIIFFSPITGVLDILSGLYLFLIILDISSGFSLIFIVWLVQKSFFSLVS